MGILDIFRRGEVPQKLSAIQTEKQRVANEGIKSELQRRHDQAMDAFKVLLSNANTEAEARAIIKNKVVPLIEAGIVNYQDISEIIETLRTNPVVWAWHENILKMLEKADEQAMQSEKVGQ